MIAGSSGTPFATVRGAGLETETSDLAHSGDEGARIKPADHVTTGLVLARAEIRAVEDAGVRVDASAAVTFEAGGAAQRWRMARSVVP
jgi:hypothetical protein